MISVSDFYDYAYNEFRDELWITHESWFFDNDVYIKAGIWTYYGAHYEFYITDATIDLIHTHDRTILEIWDVDPRIERPFYWSDHCIQFVTDDTSMDEPYAAEIRITGSKFFVVPHYYSFEKPQSGPRGVPKPGMTADEIERTTRFQELIFNN